MNRHKMSVDFINICLKQYLLPKYTDIIKSEYKASLIWNKRHFDTGYWYAIFTETFLLFGLRNASTLIFLFNIVFQLCLHIIRRLLCILCSRSIFLFKKCICWKPFVESQIFGTVPKIIFPRSQNKTQIKNGVFINRRKRASKHHLINIHTFILPVKNERIHMKRHCLGCFSPLPFRWVLKYIVPVFHLCFSLWGEFTERLWGIFITEDSNSGPASPTFH